MMFLQPSHKLLVLPQLLSYLFSHTVPQLRSARGGTDVVGIWGLQPLATAGIMSWAPVVYLQSTILSLGRCGVFLTVPVCF